MRLARFSAFYKVSYTKTKSEKQKKLFTLPSEGSSGDLPAIGLLDAPMEQAETVSPETIANRAEEESDNGKQ